MEHLSIDKYTKVTNFCYINSTVELRMDYYFKSIYFFKI